MTPEQIRTRFEEMAKAHGPTVSNIAKVKSVNETKATCILEDEDGQEIQDVRLRPVLNGKKSFIQIPKVGTFVLAIRIEDDDDWMVIACDEIEKVVWFVGTTTFEINDGFLLKKENETLKKLMADLIGACKNLSFTVTTTGTATNQAGTTTAALNLAEFAAIETRFNQFLK
ncbi:conserved hypothetical protein [Flavobacterium psychrophilum]|uniref:hypothetical protein n=1 Tax=Flavobacterium psychrophilum TaxID=96345 RepID=UPI000B7C3990|nr:hypothetical protein [Flavobacterium psychrophilum]SNB26490.1 conserved hypothetical protein [Flavobacterium psychrophilum]